jgi:hypothetical protein
MNAQSAPSPPPPVIVSARLGHNSVAFTLDTYVDYQFDMQNQAAEQQHKRFYG